MKTSFGTKFALAFLGSAALAACQPAATAYEHGGPAPSYRTGTYGTPAPDPYADGYAYGGHSSTYQVIVENHGEPVYRDGRRGHRHGAKPVTEYQPYYQGHGHGTGHRKGHGKRGGAYEGQGQYSGYYGGKRKTSREIEAELHYQRELERQAHERARAKERARIEKQRRAAYLAEEQRRAEIRASRRPPGLSEHVPRSVAEIGIVFDGYRHVGESDASLADRVRRAQRVADVEGISIHRVLLAQKPKSFDQK